MEVVAGAKYYFARKKEPEPNTYVVPGLGSFWCTRRDSNPKRRRRRARQDFKISCFIRNILHFLHICRKYLTRFAYFT